MSERDEDRGSSPLFRRVAFKNLLLAGWLSKKPIPELPTIPVSVLSVTVLNGVPKFLCYVNISFFPCL